jgi:O-antigen/teichoic acid export membrane protein
MTAYHTEKKLVVNAVYSVIGHLMPIILFVVSLPIFTGYLGPEGYGIWVAINSIVSTIGILQFGIGDATIKYVSEYYAIDDSERLCNIIGASLFLYGMVAVLILFLGIFIVPAMMGYIAKDLTKDPTAPVAVRIVTLAVVMNIFTTVLVAVLKGVQRYDVQAKILIAREFVRILGSTVLVIKGFGILGMAVAAAGASVIGVVLAILAIRRVLRGIRIRFLFSRRDIRRIFSFSLFSFVAGVSTIAKANGGVLLITRLLGAANGAYFAVPYQIYSQMVSAFGAMTSVLFPAFSALKVRNDYIDSSRLFETSNHFVTWAASVLGVSVFILAPDILRLWLGEDFSATATTPLRLFMILGVIVSMNTTAYFLLLGHGRIRLLTALHIGNALVVLGLIIILVPYLGLIGAALAYVADLVTFSYVFVATGSLKTECKIGLAFKFYLPLTTAPMVAILTFTILKGLHLSGVMAIAIGVPLVILFFAVAALLTILVAKGQLIS